MLFAIKNRWLPALALAALFAVTAVGLREVLVLPWSFRLGWKQCGQLFLAAAVVAASDACGHCLLSAVVGQPYLAAYRALVDYFDRQGPREILAGGVLAGTEELIFRGVLLNVLIVNAGMSGAAAVAISATVFGAMHALPHKKLLPFTAWAVWEGLLLGWAYLMSGSLGVSVILHAAHDIAGFALFGYQRRTGWLLNCRP